MEPPPISGSQPPGSDKIWSVLSHLSIFIGVPFFLPLIVYLVMRDESKYVADNAREALNFHISLVIYAICAGLLTFILIGIPLLVLMGVATFILSIVAAIKAADGACYRYPLTLRLVR
jgi:uncharacterized Tic20 family protein